MKVGFLLSADFGEANSAVAFLLGRKFSAFLLMPEKLFDINSAGAGGDAWTFHLTHLTADSSPPLPCYRYRSSGDVLTVLDREQPSALLLFSGYLYVSNKTLDLPGVATLLQYLEQKRIPFATHDPFLGRFSYDLRGATPQLRLREVDAEETEDRFEQYDEVGRLLAGTSHIYHADATGFGPPGSMGFANPLFGELIPPKPPVGLGFPPGLRRWLFVLSGIDHIVQFMIHYKVGEVFYQKLAQRLVEGTHHGRQVIFVGPADCVTQVKQILPRSDQIQLLPFCSYPLFRALLFDAEYVFYWNVISSTLIARALWRLPTFFFAPGHLDTKDLQPVFEAAHQVLYGGAEFSFLDQNLPLSPEELAAKTERFQLPLERMRERILAGIPSEEVLTRLLSGKRGNPGVSVP